jgi:hypothetical protein
MRRSNNAASSGSRSSPVNPRRAQRWWRRRNFGSLFNSASSLRGECPRLFVVVVRLLDTGEEWQWSFGRSPGQLAPDDTSSNERASAAASCSHSTTARARVSVRRTGRGGSGGFPFSPRRRIVSSRLAGCRCTGDAREGKADRRCTRAPSVMGVVDRWSAHGRSGR